MARYWAFELYQEARDAQRSLADLEQDAWIGILEAWHTWDPAKGTVFKTYANYRARWAVLNGQRQVDAGLWRAYIRDKKLYERILAIGSLDDPGNNGDKGPRQDLNAESAHCDYMAWGSFLKLLSMVKNDRIRLALYRHYGQDVKLEDIGKELGGVSRERIRQLLVEGREEIKRGLKNEKK
jgi:RNA polymerase sigma factor (sigma-70 family)